MKFERVAVVTIHKYKVFLSNSKVTITGIESKGFCGSILSINKFVFVKGFAVLVL